jgi:hypothetical protein
MQKLLMPTKRKELITVFLLSLVAALRVFIFSAAFPLFSDIDEDLHLDLVTRYSHMQPPRTFDVLAPETLDWIVPYASPEYLQTPDRYPGGKFSLPLWKRSDPEAEEVAAITREDWSREVNFESSQPPLYYMAAAAWWRLGRLLGLSGVNSLFWIRFLNVGLVAALVWLGYISARTIDPAQADLRIGVPLLLAFLPQSVFFTINNDVLSPIFGGALFLCVLWWVRAPTPNLSLAPWTALAMAAAFLTKFSNLPIILVAIVVIGSKSIFSARQKPVPTLRALCLLVFCAAIPIGGWLLWTKFHFGDMTGSATKVMLLGWTRKPMADWWGHPIFTPRGFWVFWSDLLASFWRGEVKWEGVRLSAPLADRFCAVSSSLFLGVAFAASLRGGMQSLFQRRAIALAGIMFLAGVIFYGLLSIQFDFGNCINPSRDHPYFTSGRLLSGALVPFAVVYVYAIVFCLRRIFPALPLLVLGSIMILVTVSDILMNRVMFLSEYNWFHR